MQKNEFTLSGALALIFSNNNRDISAVTGWNYNTITSHKYRLKRHKLSWEKQEELILAFGFRKVGEQRYKFPHLSVKDDINNKLNTNK